MLGISQPALSRSIGLIEESTGTRLFDRDRGSVKPTVVGARLIAGGRRLLEEAFSLEHNLNIWSRSKVGSVRFGIGVLPAALFLSELLIRAISEESRLVLEPIIAPSPTLLDQLGNDDIELLICPTKITDGLSNLKVTKILDLSFGLFARREHPVESGKILDVKDANNYPIAASRYMKDDAVLAVSGLISSVLCDDFNVIKRVMLGSNTIWFCASELLIEEISSGAVKKLSAPWLDSLATSDIALVTKKNCELSVAAQHVARAAIAVTGRMKNANNCSA